MRGAYLYLYLVMDVWSRRIVGWRIAERESADIAAALMNQTCSEGNLDPRGLVLHSDNGTAMRGSTMISTLQWLGVVPSFSRPHVSDDNPYSEALFRTLKHTPAYPRLPFGNSALDFNCPRLLDFGIVKETIDEPLGKLSAFIGSSFRASASTNSSWLGISILSRGGTRE